MGILSDHAGCNGDLAEIVDTCADGVFQELDYRIEASNAAEVRDRFCTPAFRALLEAHWITQDRARKISEHFQ